MHTAAMQRLPRLARWCASRDLVIEEVIGPVALEIVSAAGVKSVHLLDAHSDLGFDAPAVCLGATLREVSCDRRLDRLLVALRPDPVEMKLETRTVAGSQSRAAICDRRSLRRQD
jgi:hypothetical protein